VTPADVGLPAGERRRTPTSHPELRLTVYAPADERSRTALAAFVAESGAR
jgi:hypothetical protein